MEKPRNKDVADIYYFLKRKYNIKESKKILDEIKNLFELEENGAIGLCNHCKKAFYESDAVYCTRCGKRLHGD